MIFNKQCAITLFFSVMASMLFSMQELKKDDSIIPGAVFFTVHTGRYCLLHQAFDSGSVQYDPSDCSEASIIKHESGHVFISYHDGAGKVIGFIEVENDKQELISYALRRLDPCAKPVAFMVFIMEDPKSGDKEIFFEGHGGEILSTKYTGKSDIGDPAFKVFNEKLDLSKIKNIFVLRFSNSENNLIIQ